MAGLALLNTGPDMTAYIAQDVRPDPDPEPWADLSDEPRRQIKSPAFARGFEIHREFIDQARTMDLRVLVAVSAAIPWSA